jgi:anhydro-N-acetylmuramic acid kinase
LLIVGLMSGTSLDGIDAALVEISGDSLADLRWELRSAMTTPYTPERREAIHRVIANGSAAEMAVLHAELGEWFADAVEEICRLGRVEVAEVDLIGSHGQTVWHQPPIAGNRGATFQIGCSATIAERTGVSVVFDFRSRDVAAGGHGAPLVPWVDRVLFAQPGKTRALQNIGGIGNVTRVPPRDSSDDILAFDTGPGNALIDAAVGTATNGRLDFDRDGALAARGEVDEKLLEELLQHPYFAAPPPKTTGREEFGRPMVVRLIELVQPEGDQDWFDLIATLTELTARSIAMAYEQWLIPRGLDEVVVTGGGALNPTLMSRISTLLKPLPVRDGSVLGIGATAKEALAFAVLAWAHARGIPANEPAATGASGRRILGSYTPGLPGQTGAKP